LALATLLIIMVTIAIPFTPLAEPLGFKQLPFSFFAALGGILLLYVISAEVVKKLFYKKVNF
jgi:Mg2+-importing ATPase